MRKQKRKSAKTEISLRNLIISGLTDLIIGVLLILIEKLIE